MTHLAMVRRLIEVGALNHPGSTQVDRAMALGAFETARELDHQETPMPDPDLLSEHDAECKRVWDEYPKLVTRLRNAKAEVARAERALGMARTIHSNNPAGHDHMGVNLSCAMCAALAVPPKEAPDA